MVNKKISRYVPILMNIASESYVNHKHAALLFSNSETYYGYNKTFGKDARTVHAEEDTLIKYKKIGATKSKKYSLLVIRINKTGNLCNSKPCADCICEFKKHNINKIYYSSSDGDIVCEKVKNMCNRESSGTKYNKMMGIIK